jgi:hypothetical protein
MKADNGVTPTHEKPAVAPTATEQRRASTKNLIDDYGDKDTLRQKLLQLKDKRQKSNYTSAVCYLMLFTLLSNASFSKWSKFFQLL